MLKQCILSGPAPKTDRDKLLLRFLRFLPFRNGQKEGKKEGNEGLKEVYLSAGLASEPAL